MNDQQLLDPVTGLPIEGVVTEITKAEVGVDIAEKTDVELFLDWSQRWVIEGVYPFMGINVAHGINKLLAEGFTSEEAHYWVEALTILQLIRINMPVPPFQQRYWVPDPPILTEYDIMRMIEAGETIPATEYEGFEGRY